MKRSLHKKQSKSFSSKKEKTSSSSLKNQRGGGRQHFFKSFNERIEEVDIFSVQKIGGYTGAGPESTDSTWFELSLSAWQELNCSAAFAKFCYAVRPHVGTLPRLLFNKAVIVQEIFSVLRGATNDPEGSIRLALIPVFCLTAMLAKDLGSEFFEYFSEYFALLTPILPSAAEPEIIEAAFASLLYVFKCILPQLVESLPQTFEMVVKPLFTNSLKARAKGSVYLRRFASQCFGYLLRKRENISKSGFFETVEEHCAQLPGLEEFIAESWCFAVLDESSGRLRTCLKPLFLEAFSVLSETPKATSWRKILRFAIVKILMQTDSTTNAPLWKILSQEDLLEPSLFAEILVDAFAYRRGSRVQLHVNLLPLVLKSRSIEMSAYFIRSMTLEVALQNRPAIIKLIEAVVETDSEKLLSLVRFLVRLNWLHYDLVLSGILVKLLVKSLKPATEDHDDKFILLLELLLPKYANARASLSDPFVVDWLGQLSQNASGTLSSRALNILVQYFSFKMPLDLKSHICQIFVAFFKGASTDVSMLQCCIDLVLNTDLSESSVGFALNEQDLLEFLKDEMNLNVPYKLRAIYAAVAVFKVEVKDASLFEEILMKCLHSNSYNWRFEALNLLQALYAGCEEKRNLVSVLLEIETSPVSLETYRDKLMHLKKLEFVPFFKSPATNDRESILAKICIHFLLGFLQIKLSLLWEEGNRILSRYATSFPKDFAVIMTELFQEFRSQSQQPKVVENSHSLTGGLDLTYEFGTADNALNSLLAIRSEISHSSQNSFNSVNELVLSLETLFPVILKLFCTHSECCLVSSIAGFRETVFIPLVVEAFSEKKTANGLNAEMSLILQSNLASILQTLSGMKKLEPTISAAGFTAGEVEQVLLRFVAHGDLQLQKRALEAIMATKKYGAALSEKWKGRIFSLTDDNQFREELTVLTTESESLPKVVHWHDLIAPLVLRILFGRLIARRGSASGRHSLPLRRRMIMACFGNWDQRSLALIVDFLLEPFEKSTSTSKHIGFLNLMEDVLGSLGRSIDELSMNRLICCLLSTLKPETKIEAEAETEDELESGSEAELELDQHSDIDLDQGSLVPVSGASADESKRIRHLGMKRLLQLFKLFDYSRLQPFIPDIFAGILNSRINLLSSQFTQSPASALIGILTVLSGLADENALIDVFINQSPRLLENVIATFAESSTKLEVLNELVSIFEGLVLKRSLPALQAIVLPHLNVLLSAFDGRLKYLAHIDGRALSRIVSLIQTLAPQVSTVALAEKLSSTIEQLLRLKSVFEGVRTDLLTALVPLLQPSSEILYSKIFQTVSSQLSTLKTRAGRDAVGSLFVRFAAMDERLVGLSDYILDFDSWSKAEKRISEPDFDRRLSAFARLKKSISDGTVFGGLEGTEFAAALLCPLAHAMIYYLQDEDELSIRNQSFGCLKTMVLKISEFEVPVETSNELGNESESGSLSDPESEDATDLVPLSDGPMPSSASAFNVVQNILLPAVKRGIKIRSEVVRNEFIGLLDLLISQFSTHQPFSSLYALIKVGINEENESVIRVENNDNNIFKNLHHIQEHRRTRAVRDIGKLARSGELVGITKATLEELLLPLVLNTALPDPTGNTVFEVSDALQQDSLTTAGQLMALLPWKEFMRRLTQYVRDIAEGRKHEAWCKAALRLLPLMISAFHDPNSEEFTTAVHENALPAMFKILHQSRAVSGSSTNPSGDSLNVKSSMRIPIAIAIGQLVHLVSRGVVDSLIVSAHLPKLLTNLLNLLKQKDADARDMARGALAKVLALFGPAFMPFFLKEGRTLLNRGYQRHVLVYTTYVILLEMMKRIKESNKASNDACGYLDLDSSAALLMDLALASCFGYQAKEREAREWSGKQMEVIAAKGPEIIALLVQSTSAWTLENVILTKLMTLATLRLSQSLNLASNTLGTGAKQESSLDIHRIEGESFGRTLVAVFSLGLIPLIKKCPERLNSSLLRRFEEILSESVDSISSSSHLHRMHAQVFEFLSFVLNSIRVGDENARLKAFVPLTLNYIIEAGKHGDSVTAALNLFNQFVAYKEFFLQQADLNPLIQRLFSIILKGTGASSGGVSSNLTSAFKLTATLIRQWPDLEITDVQIKALLEYTRLHLDSLNQQSLTFSLIRSLISRKVVLLQLFELMNTVRTVMMTSHNNTTRQQCRSTYLYFLLNYPMATKRLESELDFLLANLRYEFATGRLSVLEVMEVLVEKLPLEVIESVAEAWFVGFAVQLSQEGETECQEALIKLGALLFRRLPMGKRRGNLELLLSRWIGQSPKLAVQLAAWKLFVPIAVDMTDVSEICNRAVAILSSADDSIDSQMIVVLALKSLESLINGSRCGESLSQLLNCAADQRFFAKDASTPEIRLSVAKFWNVVFKN